MFRRSLTILILFLCLGLLFSGCPKKTVTMDEAAVTQEEAEKARLEAERARQEQELRAQEEAALKAQEEAARKAQAEKDFEKSLVAKKTPGIEGEVLESSLLKDVYFDFDKYDIRPQDTEILKGNATLLMKSSAAKIQIEGHCDERGTQEYNLALGERRANSARLYLISLGIPADRISTISFGEERPLDPGHDEGAWAKNRRGHFVILPK